MGGGAENSKLLILAWSFWGQPSSRSHPIAHLTRTKEATNPQGIQRFRNSVSGSRVKDQILEQKMLPVLLSLRLYKGFRSSVLELWHRAPKIHSSMYLFSIISQ